MLTKLVILAIAALAIIEAEEIVYHVPLIIPEAPVPSTISASSSVVQTPVVVPRSGGFLAVPADSTSSGDWKLSRSLGKYQYLMITPTKPGNCTTSLTRKDCNVCSCNFAFTKCTRIDCTALPLAVKTSNAMIDAMLPAWPGDAGIAETGKVYRFMTGYAVRYSPTGIFVVY